MSKLDLSAAREVVQSVAKLLESGRFSDLKLSCCKHDFFVHKAIVCPRSPIWAAAVEGEFQESRTGVIEVEVVDAATLKRALTYLYTGVYDDEDNALTECAVLSPENVRSKSQYGTSAREPAQSDGNGPREHEAQLVETQYEQQKAAGTTDKACRNCQAAAEDELGVTCTNAKLRANVFTYVFADYYQIPELERIAVSKFKAALKDICPNGLSDVCRIVYEDAPPSAFELRSLLSSAISRRGRQLLIEDTTFMNTALLLPELLRDILQATFDERDTALQAEEATRRRIFDTVNKSSSCKNRSCGASNHIRLDYGMSLDLGVSMYSVRCRLCRKKYDVGDI